MKRIDQRGFTPSPFISTMFGHFANVSLQRGYHKPAPIDSVYPPPEPSEPGPPCPCNVFRECDKAYTALSTVEKKVWRDALKKPGISAYNLWMKEQMTAAMNAGKLVTCPSVSGGFSCQSLELAEDPPTWENTIGLAPGLEPPPPPPPPPPLDEDGWCDYCEFETPEYYFTRMYYLPTGYGIENLPIRPTYIGGICAWVYGHPEWPSPHRVDLSLGEIIHEGDMWSQMYCWYRVGPPNWWVTFKSEPIAPWWHECYDTFILSFVDQGPIGGDCSNAKVVCTTNWDDLWIPP